VKLNRKGPKQMTLNAFYLNLLKFLITAFVLAFTIYTAKANEIIMDLAPFPACTGCLAENAGSSSPNTIKDTEPEQAILSDDSARINIGGHSIISVAVLNPDLSDFDSVRFAIVEVADLEIAAEYLSYSLRDMNQDGKTDIVFYFSTRDLIPSHPEIKKAEHNACLIVDILKTDNTIRNYSLCEHAFFI
jgi:hypothetical protein